LADPPKTTWFNYIPLNGAGSNLKDDGSRVLCSIPIERGGDAKPLEVAIIGDATRLELIRIATPNSDGNLSELERHQINITDHVISVMRLLYDTDICRLQLAGQYLAIGQFSKDDGSPQLSVNVKVFGEQPKFDGAQLKNAVVATAAIRIQMSLLADALNPATPLAFRYLCFYKILEFELRKTGYWKGLDDHLKRYEKAFAELDISKAKLKNFLHNCRDKCAHIKIGRYDEIGLTGLGSKDGEIVGKFIRLLHTIVADLLNQRYSDRIQMPLPTEPVSMGNLDGTALPPEIAPTNR
jgi:hypothetical protein